MHKENEGIQFTVWCSSTNSTVDNHSLCILTGNPASLAIGIQATAAVVPTHYAAEEQISRALNRLGKKGAAALVQIQLPTTQNIRSGDLGEIYATEWIDTHSGGYKTPIKRLRWKDHRNMAMRGDDVIGFLQDPQTKRLHFLKTEAKSRITLKSKTITDARTGLDKDGGLPSAHALAFISARLVDLGNTPLADAIDDAFLKNSIPVESVRHLVFTFSGNSPNAFLTASLQSYSGTIKQWCIGLHVDGHATFISAVYNQVPSWTRFYRPSGFPARLLSMDQAQHSQTLGEADHPYDYHLSKSFLKPLLNPNAQRGNRLND